MILKYWLIPEADLDVIEFWEMFYIWSKVIQNKLIIINKETHARKFN